MRAPLAGTCLCLALAIQPAAQTPPPSTASALVDGLSARERGLILVRWYGAFVAYNPSLVLVPLPFQIPGTSDNKLFTLRTLQASSMSDGQRQGLADVIRQVLARYSDPDRIAFVNPRPERGSDSFAIRSDLERAPFIIDAGVDALVNYGLFRSGTDQFIPARMLQVLQGEAERLARVLTPAQRMQLGNVQVRAQRPGSGAAVLWVENQKSPDSRSTLITISPVLVRTIFMQIVQGTSVAGAYREMLALKIDPLTFDGAITSQFVAAHRDRSRADLEFFMRFVDDKGTWSRFFQSFDFILAHEMAHRFVTPVVKGTDAERAYDAAAVAVVEAANGRLDLGAFRDMFAMALRQGSSSLWGFESADDAAGVMDRLNALGLPK